MFADVTMLTYRRRSASELSIVTGNVNRRINDIDTIHRKVKKIIVHQNYTHHSKDFSNDIAILIVSNDYRLSCCIFDS